MGWKVYGSVIVQALALEGRRGAPPRTLLPELERNSVATKLQLTGLGSPRSDAFSPP
jgi:hypothetical protein